MRSVRATFGTPPEASKELTSPSKVWQASIEVVNPKCANGSSTVRPKHQTSPKPQRRSSRTVRPVELSLLAGGRLDRHAHSRRARNLGPRRSRENRTTLGYEPQKPSAVMIS